MKTISDRGLDIIKEFEGYRPQAYLCPAGVWTIGYGHTQGVTADMIIGEKEATEFLRQDVKEAEQVVNHLVKKEITQCQFDALVSLVFNIGSGNFQSSTILRLINTDCFDIAKHERAFKMWNKAGGRVLRGLSRRRDKEFELYRKGLWFDR